MADDDGHNEDCLLEDRAPDREGMSGGNAMEALTRVEHHLFYSSEKLLNLEKLLMQVASGANDLEARSLEYEDISDESTEKAVELEVLSEILVMKVRELQSFITSLHIEIVEAQQNPSHDDRPEEYAIKIKEKLHNAADSVKKLQDLVTDLIRQSAMFERTFAFSHKESCSNEGEELGNSHSLSIGDKSKLQTVDQRRDILRVLEKSLTGELDLERKLSDSRSNKEKLKLKLHYAEREMCCMEDSIDISLERMFEAENAANLLFGISNELAGRIQVAHLNLNSSIRREQEMKSKLQESMMNLSAEEAAMESLTTTFAEVDDMLMSKDHVRKPSRKDAKDKYMLTSSEVLNMREKVRILEGQLREYDIQLKLAKSFVETSQEEQCILHSELSQMDIVIEDLNTALLSNERKAERAEAECAELSKTNMELSDELGFLRSNGSEMAHILERELKESDSQLELAKASIEAIEEQKNILYAEIIDMENTINDLKEKLSNAELRAENAESNCNLLAEINLELNEETGFLRGRLGSLETSLHQAEDVKIATAKDIGIRTKIISDLVMKLALERECLQLQISALTTKNKILSEKIVEKDDMHVLPSCQGNDDATEFGFVNSSEEALTESLTTDFQVDKSAAAAMPVCKISKETTFSAASSSISDSRIERVKSEEAAQVDWKYIFMATLVLLISVLTFCMYQQQSTYM